MMELTQDILKELLHYDPETGVFTWKYRDRKWFKTDRSCTYFNNRYANTITGSVHNTGYVRVKLFGKTVEAHRLAWLYVHGVMPKEVDHINQNPSENNITNLSDGTHSQNMVNKGLYKTNKSGIVGVNFDDRYNKWHSQIQRHGTKVDLGSFDNLLGAAAARKSAEIKYGFHVNHGGSLA